MAAFLAKVTITEEVTLLHCHSHLPQVYPVASGNDKLVAQTGPRPKEKQMHPTNKLSHVSKMFAIALVVIASFLVGCGGGSGGPGNTDVPCPSGQQHSTQNHSTTLDCVPISTQDTAPPAGRITSPADGATIYGNVELTATVSDAGSGVKTAQFQLDGTMLQSISLGTTAPTNAWDTTKATEGAHTLAVYACDNANNCGVVATAHVTVANQSVDALCPQKIKDDLGHLQQVTNCAVSGVKENGHFKLFVKNGACWAMIVDDGPNFTVNSRMAESPAASVQYASTASGQPVTVPDVQESATCKWK